MSEQNKFYMRLPRNSKEFPLFLFVVSFISVNLIAPVIAMMNSEFSFQIWEKY